MLRDSPLTETDRRGRCLLTACLQEGNEVGQVPGRELLVKARRHDRDGACADFLDLVARDPRLLVRAGRQDDLVRRILQRYAVVDLAVLRRNHERLEAPHEAGAWEDD